MKVLDLFSGIGGFSIGLEAAGMKTIAFCEQRKESQNVLRNIWPDVPIFDDIRTLDGKQFEGTEVICGGFPCQDISNIGKRVGIKGSRSGLWGEFFRIIGEVRPKIVIVENVAALNFRGLGQVLGDLATIRYDAEWHVISASSVGAPHERKRCWIIAYPQSESRLYQLDIGKEAARLLDYNPSWRTCPFDAPESCFYRMDDGVSDRTYRTEMLGNAVVPFIPEIIGRAIMKNQNNTSSCV